MRPVLIILFLISLLVTGLTRPPSPTPSPGVTTAVEYFRAEAPVFARRCTDLRSAIQSMDIRDSRSVAAVRRKLIDCRASWKRIESFLEYFFPTSSRIYNRAPKFEAEEPGMEYQSPLGLQVIETLLYETNTPDRRRQLLEQSSAVASSASDLPALLYDFRAGDPQILESLRIELIRIITLDITGYDAPYLKTGIAEAAGSLQSLRHQLEPYGPSDSLQSCLDSSIAYCKAHENFDTFDRLKFLKYYALPLQRQLHRLIQQKDLQVHTGEATNYTDLFSPDALLPGNSDTALAAEGSRLFYDKSLSGNGQRSCATCHAPEKKFTDGLTTPLAFDGHSRLDRNAPSLLYSGYQHRQFWDGRAATLEEQIATVLQDPKEMHSTRSDISTVAKAIGAYIRTLHPQHSPFDIFIEGGPDSLLTASQVKGANLFMGKAQCATCHFMPLFNGLIPPDYAVTEFEVLGTTRTDRLDKPQLSKDPGRYNVYPLPFFKGAFKTPTVRNTAVTAPYMHNGAFRSLEKVLEFYNKGGGQGLGLRMPSQTLSSHALGLTKKEMQDIIQFLHALTDNP
ncbi:cytochrome c peroxidase [Flavitalea sp. BT771]|uniref:cytochrome-c peroxidase n=1 Tax=Flavitalea sp. BT771 TaxID=3063329 RepID=UPI0026E163FD|nr:cytochrome c peroxidase [Flavitalea sp. BT771]MDO6430748.1 cytochrome c peroxidase [Flavitalea sp. BT771]MDV6219112.1 cytochrome c peroxidase [Flavitalea sp. BT771]